MTDKEGANIFNIPQFITKSRDYVEQSQQSQLNNIQLSQQDEILQTEVEEEEKKSPRLDQLNTYNKCQQYDDREQRTNQNQIKVEQNQDNILFTTDTNEIIKTSNETEQNIIKASPQMQFCQNRNESYQMYTDRPLNEINKIPQSASIYKGNETQRINSIFQKDITLLFTDRQIEQPNLIGQDQQKQQNCLKTVAQVNNTNQNSNKNSSTIEYYIQKLKTIQDISIFKRFTKINFGYRFTLQKINCFKKNSTEEGKKKLSSQQKIFIEQQVLKSMNILELLKDVIFIKKSIMLIMSKDQLAAMKLVGYSENYIQDHYLKKEVGGTQLNKLNIGQEITEKEVANNINIPQFITKSRIQIEQNIQTQINNTLNNIQEEISKSEDDKKTNEDNQLSKIKKYQQQLNNKKINNQNQKLSEDVFQYNNTIITSASNDIKNSNDSYQDDILKTSPRTQLSTLKTEQSEIQTHRPLILLSKIPQSASIVQRSDRQTNSSESQKDVMICLTQNQIQQSNQTSQQNKQKLQDNQKPKLDKKDMLSTPKRRINVIEYYIQKFRTIQDLNIFQKFTQINFGYRFTLQKLNCFRKKDEDQEHKNLSIQQKKFIEQQVLKSMNVLELLKDVIFIKKAIMLLLTKDQLAAIKLVGYSENYIQDTFLQKDVGKLQRDNTYFEKQLDIFDSTELSCQYIKKFIQKCNSSKILDKVDKRILSSINKNSYNLY
ncbi:hypothetical protein ABPG73_018922 [Tetrahymena malaccensis]